MTAWGRMKEFAWTTSDSPLFTQIAWHKDKLMTPPLEAFIRLTRKIYLSIRLLASGVIDGKAVITSEISLDDIVDKGFELLTKDRSQCKILVNMNL